MPSTSQQQQKLFGLALSVKIGDTPRSEVSDDVLNIVDTMSEKDIKDFAETSHSGLPKKIESYVRELVRETFKNKILGEIKFDSNGNLKIKKQYDSISDYEKVATKGDHIWFGKDVSEFDDVKSGVGRLSKVVGRDSEGNVIFTPYSGKTKFTIPVKKWKVIVVESINEAPTRRSNDFFEDDNKYGIELHKLLRGKWDRDKVLQYFIKLQSSAKDKYQNVLYFIANGLGINGRSYKNTVDLRDDIITAIGNLYTLHNESVNEAPTQKSNNFFKVNKHGYIIYNMLGGQWDRNKVEKYFDSLKSSESGHGGWFAHLKGTAELVGVDPYKYRISRDKLVDAIIDGAEKLYKIHTESVNEESEQLDEKLITFSNRAPYGQVVFIAGGAGSGKGFAIEKFIDSSGFKVRDVDEMKKQIQKLNAIGKLSIQQIIDRFGKNITPKDMEIIKRIQSDGFDLKNMNLKNPDHVYALHIMVDAMGIKDKSLEAMLAAKSNPETLPNIIFDITAKKITGITEVLPMLNSVGYKPENIHLVWVLTDYQIAIQQNKGRARVVPDDIMLQTHVGAGNTVWGIVTSALPKGMNGRVDVILNNRDNTINYKDKNDKDILVQPKGKKSAEPVVRGFLSLPIKKQGGGILPEKLWKDTLYSWIKDNGPEELTANFK